jgi:DNA-binding NtrC family response regulator
MSALERHTWPGNIRELKNTIERAVLLSDGGSIRAQDIQLEGSGSLALSAEPTALGRLALRRDYANFERTRILAALEQAAGNQTEAAKRLGVSRRTLMNRLDALDLPRPRKRPR